jgi:uncharacterized membrane protein
MSTGLAALSDGIFAVAMTLLVLDLHAPLVRDIRGDADLLHALFGLALRLAVYLMSFLTLGIFWVGQQTQLNNLSYADRDLTWIHLAFLFAVTVMPFSTGLMAEFIHYPTALVIYWANILMFGVLLLASWHYAGSAGLVRDEMAPETARSIECRIILAQALYAFGALLSIFSTIWSIGFTILVQPNRAAAPKIGALRRV